MDEQNRQFDYPSISQLYHWLFNPFYYVAGTKALFIGILIIIATGVFGFMGKMRLDGPMTFRIGLTPPTLSLSLLECFLTWIVMSIFLFFWGKILTKRKFRAIDIFGTQALARFPYLLVAFVILFFPGIRDFANELVKALGNGKDAMPAFSFDMASYAFITFLTWLMLAWMLVLMYRSFAVSCNVSGKSAIALFIVSILLSEIIIKLIVYNLQPAWL